VPGWSACSSSRDPHGAHRCRRHRDFLREVGQVAGIDTGPAIAAAQTRLPWFSRSVDSTYLTGKRVFIFGDATHAIAAARIATEELGFEVVGSAPTAANSPARCAPPPKATASRP
jgi:nitrogenase molybdenum-iron protein alpha/beta subunit